ncbi:hypothetical protein EDD17DRAFT_1502901 [Pisolithus thermaeus]|nr:hypothetical protein EDD17DRAFT_1502901 [Pisolithus thermaeus]
MASGIQFPSKGSQEVWLVPEDMLPMWVVKEEGGTFQLLVKICLNTGKSSCTPPAALVTSPLAKTKRKFISPLQVISLQMIPSMGEWAANSERFQVSVMNCLISSSTNSGKLERQILQACEET